ncbi:hypothetical protein [Methylomonas rosea]|uniref:Uncharacterized protein n=1 Tax=Methylomonas rosea TaxID=2952227 RepID=A0ABT1TMY0_9GAMM|nr:hypothetical protein [Methylomonas sp. WSC-7]MCQ8116126.1 hypothetical protein [Methylomonas sp. WSC-7]
MKQQWLGYAFALVIGFTGGYWVKSDVPVEVDVAQAAVKPSDIEPEKQNTAPESIQTPSQHIEKEPSEEDKRKAVIALIRSYTLQQVIDLTKPEMEDIQGGDISKGTAMLALWASTNLKWDELTDLPNTKHGLVMKDSAPQLGKRLCVKGQVIEIERDRTIDEPLYSGGMFDDAARIYRFLAVASTGEIVANTHVGFCGIVTGQQHYPNSAGGMAHAVQLVGMFDLPENKPGDASKQSKIKR